MYVGMRKLSVLTVCVNLFFSCASISEVFNMGGCPLAMGPDKCDVVPGECDGHLVDVGGHWELKTTQMGVTYGLDLESGTGNDPIANKDDE